MRNKNSPGALAGAAEAGIEWFDRPEDTTLQDGMSLSGAMAEPQSPDAPAIDLEAEIARLAGLSKIAYEKARRPAADKFGMRVSVIDELIAEKRGDGKDRDGGAQGRPLSLPEPQPWPEPVDGAALLDALSSAIRRHVVLSQAAADAVALWVVGVHAFDAWRIYPRLFITAPEKRSGKTTLIEVLALLVTKPLRGESITAAAVFRIIETVQPTMLLDEADHYRRDNEELRAVINSGHARSGNVIRNVPVGDGWEPREFSTWAPMALAAIGRLWATVEDRAITVALRRKAPDEYVEGLRNGSAGLEKMARMTARWAADHVAELAAADPAMPCGIVNRVADNWAPLLAVADSAAGDWPRRAREAAVVLCAVPDESQSPGEVLLSDLRPLFDAEPSGVLFTRDILARLIRDETRPWPEWKAGKPLTETQLARLVKPYRIAPKTVRRGVDTGKGYRREWFDDAFRRYLPPEAVTPSQPSDSAAFGDIPAVTNPAHVTAPATVKLSVSAGCDGVTAKAAKQDGWSLEL